MQKTTHLPHIRNITVSGRIASGQTTLAKSLSEALGWKMWEGGALTERYYIETLKNVDEIDVDARPDSHEVWMDELIKKMLVEDEHQIIQSNLAGFDALGLKGVFKILTVCEDKEGIDQTSIRIDRLINRKGVSVEEAKRNIIMRERRNREKWSRLYADNNPQWVYWDKKYYDLIINTYILNKEESVKKALDVIYG